MSIFRKKEVRSEDEGTVQFESTLLQALLGRKAIGKDEAMQIPTVRACIGLIADKISMLPLKLYEETDGEVKEVTGDIRTKLINGDTGDTINGTELKKRWVIDYFLGKGAYTYIQRDGFGKPCGLYYVDESDVCVTSGVDPIFKSYVINVGGKNYLPYEFLKILRNSKGKGVGVSIISESSQVLAIAYNTMKFENASVKKGGNKRGFLKSEHKADKETIDYIKEAWANLYSNDADVADNVIVLNNGIDFKESSNTSVEMQLNENKITNAKEICKIFCMPPEIISGGASEAVVSLCVQDCFAPVINTIEAAIDHDLLEEREKGNRYFAFDTNDLTRGDFAKRMNAYAVALKENIYQLDEIREREDLPPLGFNYIKLGLQDVLLNPKTMDVYTPNTKEMVSLESGKRSLTSEERRAIMELRYSGQARKKGKFWFGKARMTKGEKERVSSGILTDHPKYEVGKNYVYEFGEYSYFFEVKGYGNYYFKEKVKISPRNKKKMDFMRSYADE